MLDVRDTIRARGASVFYLPPYSPDLNSIEHAFAKLKTLFRTAARLPSTRSGTRSATPTTECANYLALAGYVPSNRETL